MIPITHSDGRRLHCADGKLLSIDATGVAHLWSAESGECLAKVALGVCPRSACRWLSDGSLALETWTRECVEEQWRITLLDGSLNVVGDIESASIVSLLEVQKRCKPSRTQYDVLRFGRNRKTEPSPGLIEV